MSGMPASANTSASDSVAVVIPTAPPANWARATSTHLWVLACGRRATPTWDKRLVMRSMFAFIRSTSTTRHGVSRSPGTLQSGKPVG